MQTHATWKSNFTRLLNKKNILKMDRDTLGELKISNNSVDGRNQVRNVDISPQDWTPCVLS